MFGKTLGQIGYDAYGDYAGWKNFREEPMPTWEALPHHIQDTWQAAAARIKAAQAKPDERAMEIVMYLTSGSVGWRWDDREQRMIYYDISGAKITPEELSAVSKALSAKIFYA